MKEEGVIVAELEPGLAYRLEERLGFDVPHRSADFGDDDIGAGGFRGVQKFLFDFVGDVRNDLDASAEVIPSSFFFNDRAIDFARGN